MGSNMDLVRATLFIAVCISLFYNIVISWIRLGERQLGVTEKYENAEALLFPSVTMCPVVNVDKESFEAAVLNSNSAELWFNSISDHSSKLTLQGVIQSLGHHREVTSPRHQVVR